jgi:hypothetical protein
MDGSVRVSTRRCRAGGETSSLPVPHGKLPLKFSGTPESQVYVVDASTNLADWQPDGVLGFEDAETGGAQRLGFS